MKLVEALRKFEIQLEADGRSAHTIGQYRRHVRLLDRWLREEENSARIEDIGHEDVAVFLSSATARTRPDGKPKKATSVNALRTSLRCFFAFCEHAEYCAKSPARLVRRGRCSGPQPRALTAEEEDRLIAVLGGAQPRDRLLVLLMLRTGVRLGSAVALDIEDLDLEVGELRLRVKGDREQVVYVPEAVCQELRRWIGDRRCGPVFPGRNGERITARHASRRFRAILDAARITRVRGTHVLRHSFAMRIYWKTGDLMVTQAALGHASATSTQVYARADSERIRAAVAIQAQVRGSA